MNTLTAQFLESEMRKYRPNTLITRLLHLGSLYPVLQPEFLKLVDVAEAVSSPSKYLYHSIHADFVWQKLPLYLRTIFMAGEHLVPTVMSDTIMRYVINEHLAPHFLLKDENAYLKVRAQYEKEGAGIVLDVVGEDALFVADADNYFQSYGHAINMVGDGGKVAVKLSSLLSSVSFQASNYTENKLLLKEKFAKILVIAEKCHVDITLDAEEYFKWCLLIEDVFCETMLEERWRKLPHIGIALQAYRKDSYASAERLVATAKKRGRPLTVRVVKGAYWDTEHCIAEQNGWDFPLYEMKELTDENYNHIVSLFARNRDYIYTAVATHNPETIAYALEKFDGDHSNFELQVLYGLGEPSRRALCRNGINISVYCPMIRSGGSTAEGIAYLIRRLLENMAGNSCLLKNL